MKLVLLAPSENWYVRDLRRAAGERHQIGRVAHDGLVGVLGNANQDPDAEGRMLADANAVLVRTMPPGSLEQVVFRMDLLQQLARTGKVIVNSPRCIEAAVDKYLAAARCEAAGLTVPPTVVCQSASQALSAFDQLGGDVVVKPLFGGEGRGICRVSDREMAVRVAKTLERLDAVLYLQKFIEHEGYDLRLLVLGRRVFGMRRRNRHDWRTNVSRGATTEAFAPDNQLVEIAQRAAVAVGAEIAGVDVLPARDGKRYVLEVNGVPGWKALAATLDMDIAAMILEHLAALVRGKERVS
jgi:ribosomal protein S6--L-glutamate ligase